MTRRTVDFRIAFSILLLLSFVPAAARDVPALRARVNDDANLIPPEQEQRIEARLAEFETQTGSQVAVLTIDSLEGEPIENVVIENCTFKNAKEASVLVFVGSMTLKNFSLIPAKGADTK